MLRTSPPLANIILDCDFPSFPKIGKTQEDGLKSGQLISRILITIIGGTSPPSWPNFFVSMILKDLKEVNEVTFESFTPSSFWQERQNGKKPSLCLLMNLVSGPGKSTVLAD